MKMAGMGWSIVGVMLCAGIVGAAESRVKVTADRVNLRARPVFESEVVCQAQTGDLLVPVSEEGDWQGVYAPTSAPVWVHSAFVTNGQVQTRLKIRGGPGINFSSIGLLQKGESVVVRTTTGDWMQIEPSTSCVLWIHKDYVKAETVEPVPASAPVAPAAVEPAPVAAPAVPTAAVPPLSPVPPVAPVPASPVAPAAVPPVVPPVAAPTPPDLAAQGLKPEAPQGIRKVWTGQVQPIDFIFNRPGNYRLVKPGEGRSATVCYLKGNDAQLSSFVGRKVQVTGWEYWLSQNDFPVIVPETIALVP